MSVYHIDRKLWKESMKGRNNLRFSIWKFNEGSIWIGDRTLMVMRSLVAVFTLFDVFCSSTVKEYSGTAGDKGQLCVYYLLLQEAIATEACRTPEHEPLRTCPTCMLPWLWRTSLGFFNHNEADDKEMTRIMAGSSPYDIPFAHQCKSFINISSTITLSCHVSLVNGPKSMEQMERAVG